MFQSIENESIAEIIVKKSKFIATLYEANSKDEAEKILQNVRKKYFDAKHHCYAYIIEKIEKCSDDGEPSGTAGAPLLALLKSANLTNVIIIVTRYFGGILLGTGGLVRAYTESAKNAIENAKIVYKDYGIQFEIEISYNNLKDYCKTQGINGWFYYSYNGDITYKELVWDQENNIWFSYNNPKLQIGKNFQSSANQFSAVRRWVCPAYGIYCIKIKILPLTQCKYSVFYIKKNFSTSIKIIKKI